MEIRNIHQSTTFKQHVTSCTKETHTHIDTIRAFNDFNKFETRHTLVSLVNWSKTPLKADFNLHLGLYGIALRYLENQEGKLSFILPGQVLGLKQKNEADNPKGYTLVFHPDLIQGTSMVNTIHRWNFFSHCLFDKFLHLLPEERQLVSDCFTNIALELEYSLDKHSKKLIVSHIERLVNYCQRFYSRQFPLPKNCSTGVLQRFDELLNHYFSTEEPSEMGIPSVAYFADRLHLSPNYFGDLIKKETGKPPLEYIQHKIVDEAKNKISEGKKSINEVAYELGFTYPQHFSRFFKKIVGQSPNEFRATCLR
uniref:Transcriptional regulator, AraC family n=1 Tax=Sphingobacterium sp. (strain 21) TaxID=743722 RepID=F4CF28_SPHS2